MFVIYEKESTLYLSHYHSKSQDRYVTERAAKAALTRACKADVTLIKENFAIADYDDFYCNIEKQEVRHGIIHSEGKQFTVGVNTRWSSGPWSESYHCS